MRTELTEPTAPTALTALTELTELTAQGPVLFFDGECGLCDRWVRLLLEADRYGTLRFAPLQGETARRFLPRERAERLDTLVLAEGGRLHLRSEAVLRAAAGLGGPWRVLALARLLARPLRDRAYDFIAARRTRWFGRLDACRVPTPEERARFLP